MKEAPTAAEASEFLFLKNIWIFENDLFSETEYAGLWKGTPTTAKTKSIFYN